MGNSSRSSKAYSRQLFSGEPSTAIFGEDGLLGEKHRRKTTLIRGRNKKRLSGETPPWLSGAKKMRKTTSGQFSEGRFLNPDLAPQLLEAASSPDGAISYGEWELPRNVTAYQQNYGVILTLPDSSSEQVLFMYGMSARVRSEEEHLNPASRYEASDGAHFRVIVKLSFPPAKKNGLH